MNGHMERFVYQRLSELDKRVEKLLKHSYMMSLLVLVFKQLKYN